MSRSETNDPMKGIVDAFVSAVNASVAIGEEGIANAAGSKVVNVFGSNVVVNVPGSTVEAESKAMADLDKRLERAKEYGKRVESRLGSLLTLAFQASSYFLAFQGIIIAAITNRDSILKCDDKWFPMILSLSAALLNVSAIYYVGHQYIMELRERSVATTALIKVQAQKDALLKKPSVGINALEAAQQAAMEAARNKESKPDSNWKVYGVMLFCMVVFVGFEAMVVIGCKRFLCRKH